MNPFRRLVTAYQYQRRKPKTKSQQPITTEISMLDRILGSSEGKQTRYVAAKNSANQVRQLRDLTRGVDFDSSAGTTKGTSTGE